MGDRIGDEALARTGWAGERDIQVLADPGGAGHLVQGITIQAPSDLQSQILERRCLRESGPALAQSARVTLEQAQLAAGLAINC